MKKSLTTKCNISFTLTLFLLVLKFYSFAQMPSQYAGAVNQIFSQQAMNNFNRTMMNNMLLNNINYLPNSSYKFEVIFSKDNIQNVESKIYTDTILRKAYIIKVNRKEPKDSPKREQKIYVNETQQISRLLNNVTRERSVGIATDSCWRFKVISGKINAYSFLSEVYNINSFYLNGIQFDSGPIQNFDPKELKKIISYNSRAMKVFEKKDYYKAILMYNREQL